MMKFLRIALLIVSLDSIANAEQSGGFLGLEIGYGTLSVPFNYELATTQNNNTTVTQKISGNFNGGGVAFGFVGGYKQFITPYFGLRYYANINVLMAKVSPKVSDTAGNIILDRGNNRSATLVNYGFDFDVLVNFIVREKNRVADFGMFAGLGLGGNNWSGQAIDDIDYYIKAREQLLPQGMQLGWKTARNFFDFSFNVGFRTNIEVNHGLELALRMPLAENAFLNKKTESNTNNVIFKINTKTPSYNVTLRYTYSFGKAKKLVRKVIKKRRVKKPAQPTTNNNDTL